MVEESSAEVDWHWPVDMSQVSKVLETGREMSLRAKELRVVGNLDNSGSSR